MVSGSLLLKSYNVMRQRLEMSKKGQGSGDQEATAAEKEPRVRKPSQTTYTHDTSSQGPRQQQRPCLAVPSPRVRSGCLFKKPPAVPSACGRMLSSWAIRDSHCRIGLEKLRLSPSRRSLLALSGLE